MYSHTLYLLQSALSSRIPNYDGQSGKVLMVFVLERDDCIALRPNDSSKEEKDHSHYQVIY